MKQDELKTLRRKIMNERHYYQNRLWPEEAMSIESIKREKDRAVYVCNQILDWIDSILDERKKP